MWIHRQRSLPGAPDSLIAPDSDAHVPRVGQSDFLREHDRAFAHVSCGGSMSKNGTARF